MDAIARKGLHDLEVKSWNEYGNRLAPHPIEKDVAVARALP